MDLNTQIYLEYLDFLLFSIPHNPLESGVFLLEFERALKQLSGRNYLSIPYWDSRDDRNTGSSTFWHNGFLAPSRLTWTVSRSFGQGTLASATTVNNILNQSTFINANGTNDNFSRFLEISHHNEGHAWIGGTMNSSQSPLDPIFFLHHCMVDKLWDDWEERTPWTQSEITINGGNGETMIHYNGPSDGYRYNFWASDPFGRAVNLPVYSNENDPSRRWDTWYSDYSSKSVVLHGYGAGLAFDIADYNPYTYRYVSATSPGGSTVTGHIHAGNITRSGGIVVASNDWGGIRVVNGTTCDFLAGGSVQFWPGFEAEYGTNVSAKIITTHSGARQSAESEQSAFNDTESESLILFPNPTQGMLNLKIPLSFNGKVNAEVLDIMGNALINQSSESVSSEISIDVNKLKTGLYFCRIFSENGQSKTGKFIKE
jgi:Common central domain of tyrosinase/Secretion system C-terminal sorting domain